MGWPHLLVNEADVPTIVEGRMVQADGADERQGREGGPGRARGDFDSLGLDEARQAKAQAIQWLPAAGNVAIAVRMADASVSEGLAEPQITEEKADATIQLERLFFARVDSVSPEKVGLYFTSR